MREEVEVSISGGGGCAAQTFSVFTLAPASVRRPSAILACAGVLTIGFPAQYAAGWWADLVKKCFGAKYSGAQVALDKFKASLVEGLMKRCTGHWHVDNPSRGHAYRSVSYDCRLDPLLRDAAKAAGIKNIAELLAGDRYIIYVNPGEVRKKSFKLISADPEIIFKCRAQPSESSSKASDQKQTRGGAGAQGMVSGGVGGPSASDATTRSAQSRGAKSGAGSKGNPISSFVRNGISSMGSVDRAWPSRANRALLSS